MPAHVPVIHFLHQGRTHFLKFQFLKTIAPVGTQAFNSLWGNSSFILKSQWPSWSLVPNSLHRLKPFTSYKFRVKATNDIGDSEFSEESESLTTLQAGQCHLPAWDSCS